MSNDRIDTIDQNRPAPRIARTPEERFQWAGSAAAAPEVTPGATICNTPEAIERFRQIALLHSLKLQSVGIKTHRGQSALTIARAHYGITSRKADKAYAELRAKMIAAGVIAEETR